MWCVRQPFQLALFWTAILGNVRSQLGICKVGGHRFPELHARWQIRTNIFHISSLWNTANTFKITRITKYVVICGFIETFFKKRDKNQARPSWQTSNEYRSFVTRLLTQRGRDKMAVILPTTFSNEFSWMKTFEISLKFHWSLFLGVQLTIFQWWLDCRRIYASLGPNVFTETFSNVTSLKGTFVILLNFGAVYCLGSNWQLFITGYGNDCAEQTPLMLPSRRRADDTGANDDKVHWRMNMPLQAQWVTPGQNGRHFTDISACIFMNEKFCILIRISLKFVPKDQIDNRSALVQVMAWRRTGDKPFPELMLTQFTYAWICLTLGVSPCTSARILKTLHHCNIKWYTKLVVMTTSGAATNVKMGTMTTPRSHWKSLKVYHDVRNTDM